MVIFKSKLLTSPEAIDPQQLHPRELCRGSARTSPMQHGHRRGEKTRPDAVGRRPYFRAIQPVWFSSTIWCPKIRWFIMIFLHFFKIAILGLYCITPFREKCEKQAISQTQKSSTPLKFSGLWGTSPSVSCGQHSVCLHEESFSLFGMEDHNGFAVWQFKLQGLRLWVLKLPEISEQKPERHPGILEP
jgi:hypothetical protein